MTINARFASTCSACKGRIAAGQSIEWTRGVKAVQHTDCNVVNASAPPAVAARSDSADRRRYGSRYRSNYTRFSSGAEVFTNKRGRCEDAPCCGCCS